MKEPSLLDNIVSYFSKCKAFNLMSVSTVATLLGSIPLVAFLTYIFDEEYTSFLFLMSAILPLVLTPIAVFIIALFSKHLNYYKHHLEKELEESKKKDLMLFEQARFVLMGEMMANISHQWKQPLNNIGLAIVSSRLNATPQQIDRNFDIMEENISYLSTTINDFMSFFEEKSSDDTKSLGNIINEVRSIMKAQIESRGIILTINIDKKLTEVNMTNVISQVLLNLLNNAKDAIDEKKIDKEIILFFGATKDGINISCCDNGIGIDKKVAGKIFDPYFTTKQKKQGTGIGLYMSKQIIKNIFDGTIVLDEYSKNTCFRIFLPCSKNCQLKKIYGVEFHDT